MAKMIGVTRISEDHYEIVTAEHQYKVECAERWNGCASYDELWVITREDGTVTEAPTFKIAQERILTEMS